MNAKQYYDCFPEYTYNTAFGSLLTGRNSIEGANAQTAIGICNNSAWNIDCYSKRQSLEETIQSPDIVEIAERIHQLRSTLLVQINPTNENHLTSSMFDIPSICSILHELASFIRTLGKEQQQIGTIIEHPYTNTLSQLSDRIEKMIKSFMDCINLSNNSQCYPPAIPVVYPYRNWPQVIDNPVLSIGCAESNVCMPWSFFERISRCAGDRDHPLGLMYGIQDENIRRKLGYRIGKHSGKRRARHKYRRNQFSSGEQSYDRDRGWIIRSTDGEISPMSKTSLASMREQFTNTDQQEINDERRSYKSIVSQGRNTPSRLDSTLTLSRQQSPSRLGSSRTLSRQQSPINSKHLSSPFRSNSDLNKSPSVHDSSSSGRMTPHATSYVGELPITSMLDHSIAQGASSRRIQEQLSNISQHDDDISARSLSFHSYGYQTPSKMTIKISRESSQSLSSVPNKSINTQQSNISTLSPKTSSINSVRKQKSASNVARSSDSKRSFKENISQNPSVYATNRAITDSTVTMTSHENIPPNDNVSNKSWEQRLASPTSITSAKRSDSVHVSQGMRSLASSKQPSSTKTTSNSNVDHYSEQQISLGGSFMNETHGDISIPNVVEGSRSAEEEEKPTHPSSQTFEKEQSIPQFSSLSTYRQHSSSTASDNNALQLFAKTNKSSSRSGRDRKRHFAYRERSDLLSQSNEQGYFHKLMNCFRRTNVDRSRYYNQ